MKNEEQKKFIIVLMRNGTIIPQYGLSYNSRNHAEQVTEYMNSILPDNARVNECYIVMKSDSI